MCLIYNVCKVEIKESAVGWLVGCVWKEMGRKGVGGGVVLSGDGNRDGG